MSAHTLSYAGQLLARPVVISRTATFSRRQVLCRSLADGDLVLVCPVLVKIDWLQLDVGVKQRPGHQWLAAHPLELAPHLLLARHRGAQDLRLVLAGRGDPRHV